MVYSSCLALRHRQFPRFFFTGLWLALGALGACGFRSDTAALERLRREIRQQTGSEASITVHTTGDATSVTIRLATPPSGDPKLAQAQIEALTKTEFPKTNYVVLLTQQ